MNACGTIESRRDEFRISEKTLKLVRFVFALTVLGTATAQSQQQWFWQNPLPQGHHLTCVRQIDGLTAYAVGEAGTVMKTTNGGVNWFVIQMGTTITLRGVWFTDPSKGVVVGDFGRVYLTQDGGTSWTVQTLNASSSFNAVTFSDAFTGTIVGFPGVIYRTTNGGITWSPQTSGGGNSYQAVSFVDANTGTVVGSLGAIFRTTNGSTWSRQVSPTTNRLTGVYFSDANTGTAVGESGTILHTTNGGKVWTVQSNVTPNNLSGVSFMDANTGIAVGASGTVLRTSDGGNQWVAQASLPANWLSGISFVDGGVATIVGSDGMIYRSTDGGLSWIAQSHGTIMDLKGIAFANSSTGIAVGVYGTLLRTTDGGRSWVPQASGKQQQTLRGVSFANSTTAFVVGSEGTILRTTDGGATWTDRSIPPTTVGLITTTLDFYSVLMRNSGLGFITGRWDELIYDPPFSTSMTKQAILSTTDGGSSWTQTLFTPQSYGVYTLFAIASRGSKLAIAVGDSAVIQRTGDGGVTWRTQTRFPRLTKGSGIQDNARVEFLSGIAFVNDTTAIAVGDAGIMTATDDGGFTWLDRPSVTTRRLRAISMIDAQNGVVVGDSALILRTSDGGFTWSPQPISITNHLYAASFLDPSNGVVAGSGGVIMASVEGGLPVAVRENQGMTVPNGFALDQNYPNPFNPATTIDFHLAATSLVSLRVFDVLGREVATLANEREPAGSYHVQWNATGFSTGIYFYQLSAGTFVHTKKMLLLK